MTKKKATKKNGAKRKLRKIPIAKAPTKNTRMGNPKKAKRSGTSRGNNLYLR